MIEKYVIPITFFIAFIIFHVISTENEKRKIRENVGKKHECPQCGLQY